MAFVITNFVGTIAPGLTVRFLELLSPPGAGLFTVIISVVEASKSDAGIIEVSVVDDEYVVTRSLPPT